MLSVEFLCRILLRLCRRAVFIYPATASAICVLLNALAYFGILINHLI
jgi:hypothetical protein